MPPSPVLGALITNNIIVYLKKMTQKRRFSKVTMEAVVMDFISLNVVMKGIKRRGN